MIPFSVFSPKICEFHLSAAFEFVINTFTNVRMNFCVRRSQFPRSNFIQLLKGLETLQLGHRRGVHVLHLNQQALAVVLNGLNTLSASDGKRQDGCVPDAHHRRSGVFEQCTVQRSYSLCFSTLTGPPSQATPIQCRLYHRGPDRKRQIAPVTISTAPSRVEDTPVC
jgi:hypothetical protein